MTAQPTSHHLDPVGEDIREIYTVFGQNQDGETLNDLLRKQHQRCACCFKPTKKLQLCSGCLSSWYCGRDCQVKDYKTGHKALCPALRKDYEDSLQVAKQIPVVGTGYEPENIDAAMRGWIDQNDRNLSIIAQASCFGKAKIAGSWNTYINTISRSTSSGVKMYINAVYRVHHGQDPLAFSDDYNNPDGSVNKIKPDKDIHYVFVTANKTRKLHSLYFRVENLQHFTLPISMPIEKFIILLNAGSLHRASNLVNSLRIASLSRAYDTKPNSPEQNKQAEICAAAIAKFDELFTATVASDKDREALQEIIKHVRDPEGGSLAHEYDSINGYPIPEVYRDGVHEIFQGMQECRLRNIHSESEKTFEAISTPAFHARLKALLADESIGSKFDRTMLKMIISSTPPNARFLYMNRFVLGFAHINMIPVTPCYEGIISTLVARLERIESQDEDTSVGAISTS